MYVKSGHKTMVHVTRKEYIKAYHIPKKKNTRVLHSPYLVALPLTPKLLSSTKLLPLFFTSDKRCITERSSFHHHTPSQKHQHHHLHHLKKKTPQ